MDRHLVMALSTTVVTYDGLETRGLWVRLTWIHKLLQRPQTFGLVLLLFPVYRCGGTRLRGAMWQVDGQVVGEWQTCLPPKTKSSVPHDMVSWTFVDVCFNLSFLKKKWQCIKRENTVGETKILDTLTLSLPTLRSSQQGWNSISLVKCIWGHVQKLQFAKWPWPHTPVTSRTAAASHACHGLILFLSHLPGVICPL